MVLGTFAGLARMILGFCNCKAADDLCFGNSGRMPYYRSIGLQIAQNRSYLDTLGLKVRVVYMLGALGNSAVNTTAIHANIPILSTPPGITIRDRSSMAVAVEVSEF